jgi:hypothetical protein
MRKVDVPTGTVLQIECVKRFLVFTIGYYK